MGETEVRTAEASGSVRHTSAAVTTPKSSSKTKSEKGSSASPKSARTARFNERGVPVTNWDNDKNDPNLRKHVGDSPNGEGNKIV